MTRKPQYYMGFARHAATASKDAETQVGAVLVGPKGEVRLTGYNGPPIGVEDRPDRLCRPSKYPWMSHAEQNIIAFAAREGIKTSGCALYVTHAPCSNCARSIIQAGIACVAVGAGKTTADAEELDIVSTMFAEADVEVVVGFGEGQTPTVETDHLREQRVIEKAEAFMVAEVLRRAAQKTNERKPT